VRGGAGLAREPRGSGGGAGGLVEWANSGGVCCVSPLQLLPGVALPSPQELKGKILVKNKRKRHQKPSEGSVKQRLTEQNSNTFSDTSSICEQLSPGPGNHVHPGAQVTMSTPGPR